MYLTHVLGTHFKRHRFCVHCVLRFTVVVVVLLKGLGHAILGNFA